MAHYMLNGECFELGNTFDQNESSNALHMQASNEESNLKFICASKKGTVVVTWRGQVPIRHVITPYMVYGSV